MSDKDSHVGRLLRDPKAPVDRGLDQVRDLALDIVHVLPFIAAGVAICAVGAVMITRRRRRRMAQGARLLSICVPPEVEPDGAALLWSALHDLLRPRWLRLLAGQPHVAWELHASQNGTQFRLWIPRTVPRGLVERAVLAAWPGATITETEVTDLGVGDYVATTELVLSGPEWFPLGGGHGSPDPLPLVLAQLAGIDTGEQALVQITARPATTSERGRLRRVARRLRVGTPPTLAGQLVDLVVTRSPRTTTRDPTVNPDVRAVMDKSTAPLYRCLVRIAVTGSSRGQVRGRIHAIASAFAAYEGRVGLRRHRVRAGARKLHERRLGRRGFLLSVPELASLGHLPTGEAIPGLVRAGARTVAPPPGLPTSGKPLGRVSGGAVALDVADSRHHIHVLGPTGVGKSTLIARMALSDLAAGRGAVVIDPKGDLVEDLLDRIPDGHEERVELLDPLDEAPPGLNVLDGQDKDLVVEQLVGIFHRIFERFWGPRTDDILRAALMTLTRVPETTLADVPRLLTDSDYRAPIVAEINDPAGLDPFWTWYHDLSEATRAQATGPVLNKLRAFLLRRHVRAIVGQPHSTLDLTRCLDNGRLLLVRVPKGILGEDTSRLLGSFVVARVWQAALARAGRPPEQRPDCAMYIDEVHNYLTLPTALEDLLAEARGYRLSLCLAHQHLAQLKREINEGVAANARTKIYFQLSVDDAAALDRDVRPELRAHDLSHLARYTAAARICREGETTPAFTLSTEPLPPSIPARADAIRQMVRSRYGTTREEVEARLAERQQQAPRLQRRVRNGQDVPISPPSSPPVSPPIKTGGPNAAVEPHSQAKSRLKSSMRHREQNTK